MDDFTDTAPTPDLGLQDATSWNSLTAWGIGFNVSRYTPSVEDLVWAGPRMLTKVGSFILGDNAARMSNGADLIQPVTVDPNLYNVMEPIAEANGGGPSMTVDGGGIRGLGSVFSYVMSRWALAVIAISIVLNRTVIYAATRRRLRLKWSARLLLRSLPLGVLAVQVVQLLLSLQCQASPDFAFLRWGDSSVRSELMFSYPNRFFNSLGAKLLGSSDVQACQAVGMIPSPDGDTGGMRGSLSRLWPLFGSFCLSRFIETLSCAVQGRPHAFETALTLFELSLAFAEADAAVNNQLAWGKLARPATSKTSISGNTITLTKSMIMWRVNTSPEVLFVALISSMTHISSHLLGIFDLQAKYRLYNTGFWLLCFITTLLWNAATFDHSDPASQGFLRFPTVCIISLVPHILVLTGIIICLFIYGSGVFLSALCPPAEEERLPLSFRERLARAHENMQANASLSEIRITREMDIYTALLRTGFTAVTMASEAVYLNEDRAVGLKDRTWLEEARLQEAEELQNTWTDIYRSTTRFDQLGAIGLVPLKEGATSSTSGYSKERAAQKVPNARAERGMRVGVNGVGASERSARWIQAIDLFVNIYKLLFRINAIVLIWALGVLRIRYRPQWLLRLARRTKGDPAAESQSVESANRPPTAGRRGIQSEMDALDIEAEIRRTGKAQTEENLDSDLYNYWISGGWWGSNDSSGDYRPQAADDDWDTTSMISATTADGQSESDWESDDGQRTPTQRSPNGSRAGSPQVDTPFTMKDLGRLLQPQSPEEQGNARALAAHFQSDRIVTRSQFKRLEQLQRTRILTNSGSGSHPIHGNVGGVPARSAKLTPEEEERLLEQLLLSRRQASAKANGPAAQAEGSAGFTGDGPQCVVCHSAPRAVIVWPCRCLSLCDDCRVSLAMNNFDKCVCCRREVMSFSRIYVP